MPLYRGRKSLQRALLLLRRAGAAEGSTDLPEPPAGTELHKYWELATGKRKLNYVRAASSNPGKKVAAKIHPFGINPPAATPPPTLVKYSNRAKGAMSAQVGDAGDLNHVTTADADPINRGRNFRAATITVFNPTGTETPETSQTLGSSYKKRAGASYTFPFGTNPTGTLAYSEVRADLLGKAIALNPDASVSFKPEILK
ncbi:MAG: hypothetical protein KME40_32045 [Komarekiella atlantica HA4396-MV6]|jgi:hypothetical protein|nr:hypothetical protein [Komarekiella atlantica HA4396-MV6]